MRIDTHPLTAGEPMLCVPNPATIGTAPAPHECETVTGVFYRTNPKLAPLVMEQSWSRLMVATQKGNQAAYERLLRQIVPFIRAIAVRRHATEDSVEDVVQEVLLSVHQVRHTYDPARLFEDWLTAIAERRSIDLLHRRPRRVSVEAADPDACATFPNPGANKEVETSTYDALGCAIADRLVHQKGVLELLRGREFPLHEPEGVSRRSILTLKTRINRALKTLRLWFGQ